MCPDALLIVLRGMYPESVRVRLRVRVRSARPAAFDAVVVEIKWRKKKSRNEKNEELKKEERTAWPWVSRTWRCRVHGT